MNLNWLRKSAVRGPTMISLLLTATPLLSSSVMVAFLLRYETYFSSFTAVAWFGMTLVFMLTSMAALSPPTLLAMIYGYFLSFWGVPYIFGLNMGAIASVYFLTKRGFRDSFLAFVNANPKSSKLLQEIKHDELKVIFLAKLSPVLPFALTNFVFALSGASLRNVLLGGFLGMIPRTLLAVWVGSQAANIGTLIAHPETANWQQWVVLLLVVVSTLGLLGIVRKAVRGSDRDTQSQT